jgi:signal transduction histidine kinase
MIVGYGYILWGLTSPGLLLKYVQMLNFVPIFFAIILSRFFIQSKVYSVGFDYFLKIFQISALVLIPASLFLNLMLADQIFFIIKIAPIPFYIGAAITAHRKGNKQALHYLIASSSFIAGIIIFNCMYGLSILPFNTFTYYIPNITIIITLSLYSITLADKINIYKAEREQARIRVLNELNGKLRAQEALAISERELEQSRKMEVVGRLLSGIAHDINNFLNPILGYSLLIKKQCQNNPQLISLADRLSHATSQLRELATSLLGITRKGGSEKVTRVDLNADIEQACSLLKHSVKKNITVIIDKVEDSLIISGDRGMIHNAIINVCMNAVDAIYDCGSITVSTCNCYLDSSHVSVRKFGVSGGQYAAVSVCDTGSGMTPEVLDHIFEPYFTTKENGKGTGLGLSNVYNCMKVHNGCIEVASEAGNGSTIVLYFPLIPEVVTGKDDSYKVRSGCIIDAVVVDGNSVSLT